MKQRLVSQLILSLSLSSSFSPGTIEVADLVTNNKDRCLLIGSFSFQRDLLNSSVAAL